MGQRGKPPDREPSVIKESGYQGSSDPGRPTHLMQQQIRRLPDQTFVSQGEKWGPECVKCGHPDPIGDCSATSDGVHVLSGPTPRSGQFVIAESLALGTAQLGDDLYPQLSEIEAERILRTAWHASIRYFDTAQSYGLSEERCGRYLPDDARIITKLHPDACEESLERIEKRIAQSFAVLRRSFIWGFLLHRERMLLRGDLMSLLWRLKDEGKIGHVGVSAESNERIRLMIPKQMDVAQFPIGITRAPEVEHRFVRSVFERGSTKDRVSAIVEARERFPGAVLVIGADSAEQVRENARMVEDACRERVA